MAPEISRRGVLALLSATVVGAITTLVTFFSDGKDEDVEENKGSGDSKAQDTDAASQQDELDDVLVLESDESHSIESGSEETYQAVDWHSNGELLLKEDATLELRASAEP